MNDIKEIRCPACNHEMKFTESEHGPDMYMCYNCGNVLPNWYVVSKEKEEKK